MEIKNEALKSLYKDLVSGVWSFCPYTKDSIDAAFKKCDDELEKEKEKLEKERDAIREESLRNIREGYKTECDLRELRQKYDYLKRSHNILGDIRNRLAKENEDLKQQNYTLGQKCHAETNTREYWRLLCNGRGEKICKLMRENAELQRQIEKEEERNKQKRLDDMRYYLHKFCENRWCDGCPLSTDEFKCGRGYRFRKWCFPDNGAIPDEDLKRYYEKVRDWEKKEEKPSEEVPCSFNWKLDGTEYTIETSIPREDYDNIVKIISGKE